MTANRNGTPYVWLSFLGPERIAQNIVAVKELVWPTSSFWPALLNQHTTSLNHGQGGFRDVG
jgi:hypothetical protein